MPLCSHCVALRRLKEHQYRGVQGGGLDSSLLQWCHGNMYTSELSRYSDLMSTLWDQQAQPQPQVYPWAGEQQCAEHSVGDDEGALDTLLAALHPNPQSWSESVVAPNSVGRLEPTVLNAKSVEMPQMLVTEDTESCAVTCDIVGEKSENTPALDEQIQGFKE